MNGLRTRSLCYVAPGRVEWRDVPSPRLRADVEAIVAPVAAGRCDFDRPVVAGVSLFPGPFAIGHEAVARVVEVGDDVGGVAPDDLVVVPPHISCGQCDRCHRGLTSHCRNAPPGGYGVPSGGIGGLFDDLVRVPFADAMLTPVPDGLDPAEIAAAGDSLSLGYGIITRHLAAGRGRVAVFGRAEHGLYQVAFAAALGAESVVYVDDDAERRDLAAGLGARTMPGPPDRADGPFDLIVDASGNEAWLRRATRMIEPGGVIECLGGHFGDIRLPGFPMYDGGVTIAFGQENNAPLIKPTLDAVAQDLVRPSALWTAHVAWDDDLPTAYLQEDRKLIAVRGATP